MILSEILVVSSFPWQINLKVDKDYPILVFGGGYLHAVSAIDGEVLWKKDFTAEGYDSLHFVFS